ncbi:isoprenylcysteine carboxylmethyltransferase family protein [bacterium BD-1]|nr:isoprenylcysteine carboxylmethyltransferase family protein [Ottowia caeni]
MPALDHKVPPPVVGLACVALAWLVSWLTPSLNFSWPLQGISAALPAALGVGVDLWALAAFRSARTTVNPLAPDRSSAVVRSGPFRFSRNPMYVGMALLLLAWCLFLGNPLAVVVVVVFVGYITRFQIVPEERALLAKFGETYANYLAEVRRWV